MEFDNEADSDAVSFEPFIGVAPIKYLDFFEKLERKATKPGQVLSRDHIDREPRFAKEFPTYLDLEAGYAKTLEEEGLVEPTQQMGGQSR